MIRANARLAGRVRTQITQVACGLAAARGYYPAVAMLCGSLLPADTRGIDVWMY